MFDRWKRYRTAYWREIPHFNADTRKMETRWELWVNKRRYWTRKEARHWAELSEIWDALMMGRPHYQHIVVHDWDLAARAGTVVKYLGVKNEEEEKV